MKLIKRVERAEGVAAERAAPAPGRMGICWSADDRCIDSAELQEGEYVATDMVISEYLGVGPEAVPLIALCERVTPHEDDLGWVTGPDGERIGRVVGLSPGLLEWVDFAEGETHGLLRGGDGDTLPAA